MGSLRGRFFCGAWLLSTAIFLVGPWDAVVHAQATALAPATSAAGSKDSVDSPTLVVSTSKLDQLMPHITYLMRAVNQPEFSGLASMIVNSYTQGMDKTRPIGVAVSLSDVGNPTPVVMLPVDDIKLFFNGLAQFGEPDDLGDGLYSLEVGPQPIFAQYEEGWLYVSPEEMAVTDFDYDPSKLLDKLSSRYDIGVRLDLQSVPEELRDSLLAQMRDSFERGASQGMDQAKRAAEDAIKAAKTDEARAAAEGRLAGFEASMEMQERQLDQLEAMVNDVSTVVFGITADSAAKALSLELATQFVEGSDLDKQIAFSSTAKTVFSGMSSDGEVMSIRGTNKTMPEYIEDAKANIEVVFSQLKQLLEQSDEKFPGATEIADELKELVLETVAEGINDSAISLSLADQLSLVGVAHVANGNKLATFLASNYEKIRSYSDEVPFIQFNKGKHAGVTLHTGAVTLPADAPSELTRVLGSPVAFAIGTADKAVYFSVGPDAESKLKAAIDKVVAKATPAAGNPFDMRVQLVPILQYVQTISDQPIVEAMIEGAKQSSAKDFVNVNTKILPHGVLGRLSIDEGVLKAVGAAAKAGQGGARRR
jgi:hypothetical protein